MNIEIANRLLQLRKEKGLSQEDLAEKLGISRQSVSKWERAEASPDTDNLICLAKIYGVSLDELLKSDDSVEKIAQEEKEINEEKEDKEAEDTIYDSDEKLEEHIKKQKAKYMFKHGKGETPIVTLLNSLIPLIAIIVFLVLGFTKDLWHPGWLVFFIVPVLSSLVKAIAYKDPRRFVDCFIIFGIITAFLFFGITKNLWHPLWLLFLIIPVVFPILNFVWPRKKYARDDR